jgi:hypothetical protein
MGPRAGDEAREDEMARSELMEGSQGSSGNLQEE